MLSKDSQHHGARKAAAIIVSTVLLSSSLIGQQTASLPQPASAQEVQELKQLVHELQLKVEKLESQQPNQAPVLAATDPAPVTAKV